MGIKHQDRPKIKQATQPAPKSSPTKNSGRAIASAKTRKLQDAYYLCVYTYSSYTYTYTNTYTYYTYTCI